MAGDGLIRLNKFLSDAGVCSRRQGDSLIAAGRVKVDGRTALLGEKITGRENVEVDSCPVCIDDEKVVLACYKERGVVCSTVDQGRCRNNIVDRIGYHKRVFPIGRLDKDTEGLILLTNDGALVNLLLKGKHGREKEYEVKTDRRVTDEDLLLMEKGGLELIPGRRTAPCRIKRTSGNSFDIIICEGMNRQIRRLCAHFGYEVEFLKRIRFDCITLGDLRPGEYRELDKEEIAGLKADG